MGTVVWLWGWGPTAWVPVPAPGLGPRGQGASGALGRRAGGTARGDPEADPAAGAIALWAAPVLPTWVRGTGSLEWLGHTAGGCGCWVPLHRGYCGVPAEGLLPCPGPRGLARLLGSPGGCDKLVRSQHLAGTLPQGCSPGRLGSGAGLGQLAQLRRPLLCAGRRCAGSKAGQGSRRAARAFCGTRSQWHRVVEAGTPAQGPWG